MLMPFVGPLANLGGKYRVNASSIWELQFRKPVRRAYQHEQGRLSLTSKPWHTAPQSLNKPQSQEDPHMRKPPLQLKNEGNSPKLGPVAGWGCQRHLTSHAPHHRRLSAVHHRCRLEHPW